MPSSFRRCCIWQKKNVAPGYNHHPWCYISDVWIRKTQSLERLWQASRGSCNTKEAVLGEEFIFLNISSGSVVKNPSAYAGDAGSIPGSGGSLGEVNGNPVQYSCLGNLMDRGTWCATVHGVAQSRHNKQLSPVQHKDRYYLLSPLY